MNEIILPPDRWPEIASVVESEFHNRMPVVGQSVFPALVDGDKLAGFVHIEHLYHFVSCYVVPEYRGQGVGPRLIESATDRVPAGHSMIWLRPDLAHEKRLGELLAQRYGARDQGLFQVFRKDVL